MRTAIAVLISFLGSALAHSHTITLRYGDRFGDGWNGRSLAFLKRDVNSSVMFDDALFDGVDDENLYAPNAGDGIEEVTLTCEGGEEVYFGMVYGRNNTLIYDLEPPIQYWEIAWQVEKNDMVYNGGWNTLLGFSCNGTNTTSDHDLLDFTANLLDLIDVCPKCAEPKPKPKPKPKGKAGHDHHRLLHADSHKSKPKPPPKPVPIKLDDGNGDGWFMSDSLVYSEFTISDASRMNLIAEGTLCPGKDSVVCEHFLPDGHYIFRASGNLDEFSGNYTWELCGKEASGYIGNEVAFQFKKGKCYADEVITVDDYINGTAIDTVLTLDGHFLMENVHFASLSEKESSFLESDLDEFINLEVSKTVSVTSVEDVEDGTLVGYRVVATHAEIELMHGTMEDVVESAAESLSEQLQGGGFIAFLRNSLQTSGLSNDKLMSVEKASFVDLDFADMVTLRNGETSTGDIVAGGNHEVVYNLVVSGDDAVKSDKPSSSFMFIDFATASGAFVLVAVIVAAVVIALKPPANVNAPEEAAETIDNSSTNLVKEEMDKSTSIDTSMDTSSTDLLSSKSREKQEENKLSFSYEDSLAAALSQRWQLNSEEDVKL